MSEDKKKTLYINHSGELLIWLIIILFFVAFSSIGFIHKEKNRENDYRIFLQDVDGLIVGSPVRMMGVEVGHVVKIKPIKDEVYVKFLITAPDVYIPQGTEVTVEFSGMAGSKSLELYPPNEKTYKDNNTPVLKVNPPKRLHDALRLLDEMYKKMNSIIYSSFIFGSKLNEEMKPYETNKNPNSKEDFNSFINYSNNFLDESTQKANDIRNNLERIKKNGK